MKINYFGKSLWQTLPEIYCKLTFHMQISSDQGYNKLKSRTKTKLKQIMGEKWNETKKRGWKTKLKSFSS